ncbi:MAG: fasciclin domain-containing protein, partial [Prevotella sp.]|nr:fasciclin domain-containing protein [Prevotella sp.]
MRVKKPFGKLMMLAVVVCSAMITSCSENIDESNLYTFTGETIEDYLLNRSDEFSNFNYVLQRTGYDKILSAYGTYTCFAPTNEAMEKYINDLYEDMSNAELPHNGMTQRGLEGLTDSLCRDIALFHLLYSEILGVDLGNGMTMNTMLGRDINSSIDSITGAVVLNSSALITSMDNELENGVLHVVDNVITRSNNLISGEMEKHKEFSIFYQALTMTGLADSLSERDRTDIQMPTKVGTGKGSGKIYTPEECIVGYTIFAETDEVLKEHGINDINDLIAYANSAYENCADPSNGWYDYYRNHNIKVSTENDYLQPNNALNMFVRYHILKYIVPFSKLVYSYNETSRVPLYEYYETMLPYTLVKIIRSNGKVYINRWVTNNTLTDRVAEMASTSISTVMKEGITPTRDKIQALNGYIHPISDMLVYADYVPRG